jgi:intracellular septation protein
MKNLAHAVRPLLNDFASTICYVVLIALKVETQVAIAAAMAFGVAHILLLWALRRPVAYLQWAGLALVLTFGWVGLLAHDPRVLMAKPTVVYLILAAIMLKPGWMLRYMPPAGKGLGEAAMVAFGYVWAGLMALTAAANLVMAVWFTKDWPAFMAVFPMASKLVLFAVQFTVVRHVSIRNARAAYSVSAPRAMDKTPVLETSTSPSGRI